MEATVSLLVADANEEYRHQFIEMLQAEPDLQVVGETGDGLVLLDQLKTLRPDVVVMEIVLGGIDGIEVLERLSQMELDYRPKILILSSYARGRLSGGRSLYVQALPAQRRMSAHPPASGFCRGP